MLVSGAALAVRPAGGRWGGFDCANLGFVSQGFADGGRAGRERLVHDPADGAGAAAALRAAAETAINLASAARAIGRVQRRPHIRVGDHITRTDDHVGPASQPLVRSATIDSGPRPGGQKKNAQFTRIPISAWSAAEAPWRRPNSPEKSMEGFASAGQPLRRRLPPG